MGADCHKRSATVQKCRRNGTRLGDRRRWPLGHDTRALQHVFPTVDDGEVVLYVQPAGVLRFQRHPVVDVNVHPHPPQRRGQPVDAAHRRRVQPAGPVQPLTLPTLGIVRCLDARVAALPVAVHLPHTLRVCPLPAAGRVPLAVSCHRVPRAVSMALAALACGLQLAAALVKHLRRQLQPAVAAPLHAAMAARSSRSCTVSLPGRTSVQMSCSRVPRATST